MGIDAHMVGGRETGNETYVKGLISGFASNPDGVELVVYHVGAAWEKPGPHVTFQPLVTANPWIRLGVELPLRSLAQHLDILHMTYTSPLLSGAPVVLTVHDICFTTNPEWFSPRDLRVLSTMVPRSIRHAAHVIAVSNEVRERIIERYRVPSEKISAIHNGPGPGAQQISEAEARRELDALGLALDRPFLVAVGNLQPRKNLVRLIEAFTDLVGSRGHDVELVIVGPKHYRAEEIVHAAASLSGRVHFTGYITDRQLAASYSICTAFVFPSLYEGFGIPLLEAMSHGVPVACSNAGALPEVCAGAALMFDPLSVPAITDAVDRILSDEQLRQNLSDAGRKRAAEFSWRKTAELTRQAYEKALRR